MRILLLLPFVFFASLSFGQGIGGKIVDENGNGIPYATLFVKEQMQGTTSNSEGSYQINLPAGQYNIQFRSMGYIAFNLLIEIDTQLVNRDITLAKQVFKLHEIRVYNSDEDPAYPIMRRAISMAPYYRKQIKSYRAEVYLKGTTIMEKIPRLIKKRAEVNAQGNQLKEGELFVGESYSTIDFEAPDRYHQKIISSRMSNRNDQKQSFDVGLFTYSVYQPDLGEQIMPLSPKAFAHYNFRYEGYLTEGDYLINKIKIIPKRKSRLLFDGYIYIVDGLWSVYFLQINDEQFFGEIKTGIQLAEVKDQLWMPISHHIKFDGGLMGIKGKVSYNSSVKYLSVEENQEVARPSLLTQYKEDAAIEKEIQTKTQQKIEQLMTKNELSNRDVARLSKLLQKEEKRKERESGVRKPLEIKETYKIDKPDSANCFNSDEWKSIRANPLTAQEIKSYQVNDSLRLAENTPKDSISTKKRKRKLGSILLGGNLSKKDARVKWHYNGLIAINDINFNAVEGWRYAQRLTLSSKTDSISSWKISPELAYSFDRNQFQWKLLGSHSIRGLRHREMGFSAGNSYVDYNGDMGVSPLIETSSTLYFKQNYARYFQQKWLEVHYKGEIRNGLWLQSKVGHYQRFHRENISNYSFAYKDRNYAPNQILNPAGLPVSLPDQTALIVEIGLHFTPFQRYSIKNGTKRNRGSSWPTFTLDYCKGIKKLTGSNSDFDLMELGIQQTIETGIFSKVSYGLSAGYFLNNNSVHFADYLTINTSPIPVNIKTSEHYFRMLPYYTYNTPAWYDQAHIKYTSSYLLLKYLPWISERLWKENIYLMYLSTPNLKHYTEAGYSLSDILFMGEIGIYSGFENGQYRSMGLRVVFKM